MVLHLGPTKNFPSFARQKTPKVLFWNKWDFKWHFFFWAKKSKAFFFLLLKIRFPKVSFSRLKTLIWCWCNQQKEVFWKKLNGFIHQFGRFLESKTEPKKKGIDAKVKQFRCTKNQNAYCFDFGGRCVRLSFFVFFFTVFSKNFCCFLSILFVFHDFFFLFQKWVIFVSEVCLCFS